MSEEPITNDPEASLTELIDPRDITHAILTVARKEPHLMVKLESQDQEDQVGPIWFRPSQMQKEYDGSGGEFHPIYDGLLTEIRNRQLKVTKLATLEIDESRPLGLTEAIRSFAKNRGFQETILGYPGRLIQAQLIPESPTSRQFPIKPKVEEKPAGKVRLPPLRRRKARAGA